MPSGEWSFIHEWTLYEYMLHRYNEGTLRLKLVVRNGKLNLKNEYKRVKYLENIKNTDFPDIKKILFEECKDVQVAEVKFITSKFNYHKKCYQKGYTYNNFIHDHGCIIVLAHDEMPKGLQEPIDVYEIDVEDFTSYIRENLIRLLNRQIHKSNYSKVWIMYQGPNFNKEAINEGVLPARESGIWCPSNNLNGFDLGKGDTVVFIKTKGARAQEVKDKFNQWILQEIYIGKVTLTITSRQHYCQLRGISESSKLWYDETETGKKDSKVRKRALKNKWKWNRVFEFKKEGVYIVNRFFSEFPNELDEFIKICEDVYKNPTAREIDNDMYLKLFQFMAKQQEEYKNNI